MKELIRKQNKWIDEQIKDLSDHEREYFYSTLYKKIPLKLIPIIDEMELMKSIDIKNWKLEYGDLKPGEASTDEIVSSMIWLWENSDISHDWLDEKSRWWNLFYCEINDWYLRSKWYIEHIMTECLVNILLND